MKAVERASKTKKPRYEGKVVRQADEIERAYREAVTDFTTASGIPVKSAYGPDDVREVDFEGDVGFPGAYPYTRGHHPLMYRGKLWNIRQITGLSTPKRLNERHKHLIGLGQNALNWEMDAPTLYGVEPDSPAAEGYTGVAGVALHTLRDVEALCEDVPYDKVSVAISSFPGVAQAYLLACKRKGYDLSSLRLVWIGAYHWLPYYGNPDQLYVNGRLSTQARWSNDLFEYCIRNMPKFNAWLA